MDWQAWYTLVVVTLMVVGLVREVFDPAVVVVAALILLLGAGVIEPKVGVAGFANQEMLTIAALYVLAAAMRETGLLTLLMQRIFAGTPHPRRSLMRLVVPLLQEFPEFNATVDGDEVLYRKAYDIGFAVDTPSGLLVAVVRDLEELDVASTAAEIVRLASAARERKITAAEMRGATFTVSNIGAVGGRFGTPIIPYGTSAILSMGRADLRPVVRDGRLGVGREFPLSLSYDHRIIDGAGGRAFMGSLIGSIEEGS